MGGATGAICVVGTLDEPSEVAPDVHIFTKSMVPWLNLPDDTPVCEVYYDTRALWQAASLERLDALVESRTEVESG
jgi:hypothetical protein